MSWKCKKFGHTTQRCEGEDRARACFRCGDLNHNAQESSNAKSFISCKQKGHRADSTKCPKSKKQRKMLSEKGRLQKASSWEWRCGGTNGTKYKCSMEDWMVCGQQGECSYLFQKQKTGDRLRRMALFWCNFTIVPLYFSPNASMEDFEDQLNRVSKEIRLETGRGGKTVSV